ncbi:MAG: type II toxin-antitoxin system HicA family toxin [Pelovirga sp.]
MTRQEKLLQRFKNKPANFRWSDLQSLLAGLGYVIVTGGKTGGSRVRFVHPERPPIIMHKPHPTPVLKRYQVEQILVFLKKEGLI